jgi:pectin methylesterase-like acyl-CoA thioesterase
MRLVSLRLVPVSLPLMLVLACGDEASEPRPEASAGAGSSVTRGGTTASGAAGSAGTSAAGSTAGGRGGTEGSAGVSFGGTSGNPSAGNTSGGIGSAGSGAGSAGTPNAAGGGNTGGASSGAGGTANVAGTSNAAGAAGEGEQPELPAGVTGLFPVPNTTGVCPDPQLRITFPAPPKLGTSGQLRVLDGDGTTVTSVNMATANVSDSIGGQTFSLPRRAFVDGNTAVIYLPSRALDYGGTYSIRVDAGAIIAPDDTPFAVTDDATWRFSTAFAAPSDLSAIDVALDGSGDFCSVQGALDALPSANTAPARITIAAGVYHEIIYANGKRNVTLHGADRKATVIAATNNNALNGGTKTRALVGFDAASDLIIENLTLHNLTPQGGTQAEALRLQNCTHCVVRDADILSLQDTLLFSGSVYLKNCYIEGNVDFVWGTGTAYFDQCEVKTVGRQGYVVQARNPSSAYGYVFVDSRITSDPGITNSTLARIDLAEYPASHVAYIDCTLGSHITAAGWTITGGSPSAQLRFWEYQSRDLAGNLVNTSQRSAGSRQLNATEAASMRDVTNVLGGWTPPD